MDACSTRNPAWWKRLHRALIAIGLGAMTTSAFAQEPIAPDAAQLLAKVRDANGAAAWQRIATLAASGQVQSSGPGGRYQAFEDARRGRYDRRQTFPVFTQREVWDGRTAWRQERSGGVHRLDGDFAMKRSATEAWLVRRAWLQPAADGAYIGPVASQTLDGRAYAIVNAVPRGGQAVTLWFDASTFDLARVQRVMPTSIEEIRYGDIRTIAGVRLPFTIETEEEGSVNVVRIARYDSRSRVPDDAFVEPKAPQDWRMAGAEVTVPLDLRNGVLTIEAKINGQGPFAFIFDTGGHAILSPELARDLKLETVGAGQSGGAGESTLTERYTRVDRVEIGGLTLNDQHFYVLPLGYPTFERGTQAPLGGLFGVELLERLAVRFDYHAKTVSFVPFASHRFDPKATIAPVRFDDDIPLVAARVDGRDGVFALDTGNSGSMLIQRVWAERVGIAEQLKRGIETASFGAGGLSRNWASRVDDFEVGGTTLHRVASRYAEDKKGAFSSRTEAGNIGSQVLANFVLDFDYRRGEMSWRYRPGYVAPPFNRGGFRAIKERAEDFTVVVVAKGSPTEAAGVRAKDRIVAIDGVAASQLSGADFADTFSKPPGTEVRLDLIRDGQPVAATVALKELLP